MKGSIVKLEQFYNFTFFPTAVDFTPSLNLKPLHFEVPGLSSDWLFTGREWLFQEIDTCLRSDDRTINKGILITGNVGFGKTAIIARLVSLSCHGHRMWPSTSDKKTMPKCEHIQTCLSFDLLLSFRLKKKKFPLKFGLKQTDQNQFKHPD